MQREDKQMDRHMPVINGEVQPRQYVKMKAKESMYRL